MFWRSRCHERAVDKGYDGDNFRGEIVRRRAKPVIPNKSNCVVMHSFNKGAYKGRNVIEGCNRGLKDFRRIAARYDRPARKNFLARFISRLSYWPN
jgi:transposase